MAAATASGEAGTCTTRGRTREGEEGLTYKFNLLCNARMAFLALGFLRQNFLQLSDDDAHRCC